MSENLGTQHTAGYQDHIMVRHSDGKSEKFPGPAYEGDILRIGRELDNDIILSDPRSSRYHAEIRRMTNGDLEVRDLESANGVLIASRRIEPLVWEKIASGQALQMAETRLVWEMSVSSQPTVGMKPTARQAAPAKPAAAASPPPQPQPQKRSNLPLIIGIILMLVLLLLLGAGIYFMMQPNQSEVANPPTAQPTSQPAAETATEEKPTPGSRDNNPESQSVGDIPTDTPTPSGPQLAIPVVEILSTEVQPIFLGALPSPDEGLLLVKARIQNLGNLDFNLSTSDFSAQTTDGSQTFAEAGGTTSEDGLRRLGVLNRFDDLNLTPGGTVVEDIIFELAAEEYDLELAFAPPDVDPIVLSMGTIDAGGALAEILGIEVVEDTPTPTLTVAPDETVEPTATPTETPEPTPTATRPPLIPAPKVVAKSSLVGKIAYPAFNGTSYDIFFGDVATGETNFWRNNASQPAFNADGSRIAFHSWAPDSRGLVTMDVTGANGKLVANFIEDQLPTWTASGDEIVFLTRRTGDRKSELVRVDSNTERTEGALIGQGEYPMIGLNGQMVFKGWGDTAYGLRVSSDGMGNMETVTNADEDTAPAISPDGSQVVFMSRREGQWDVYLINVDGSGLTRLTTDEAQDGIPTWSPDGSAIAFVSDRGGTWAIWVMTPEGDGKSLLFAMQGSPDGFVTNNIDESRGWAEERISWTK